MLALGQLRTDKAITPLITLFNQEKDSDVRRSIAFFCSTGVTKKLSIP
ncbi:MAG: HEAT repeat domain-containing protein [Thioploca sp.]|nr:HEAT repeat domain-containing protein [Thioploca sp.]